MAGKPLKLDWQQILPENEEDAPPFVLEVVATLPPSCISDPLPEAASSPIDQSLTDREIEEKIVRLKSLVESEFVKNLPDKGQKVHASMNAFKEERDRRKSMRIKEFAEKCERTTNSRTAESIGTPSNALSTSECDSQSSFFLMFNKKLDKRAGSMSTHKISCSNPSQIHEAKNFCHMTSQSARLSSRKTPFIPAGKVALTGKRRRPGNVNHININTSSFYSPLRRFSKRLKNSEGRDTLRSKKVQNVVLLDEENVQSKDLTKSASDDRMEVKMYYPTRDDPQSVELSYSDMKCLEPEQYISSPIMNFYIRYLQRLPSPVNGAKCEYYFFNTYFYGKLEAALSSLKCDRALRFSKLRRWWKGINIFEKAYIFLPIHKVLHWSLVIISIPPEEDQSCPIILHLDSLGLHNSSQILKVIQCYLKEEWNHVKQTSDKIVIEKQEIKVPQQENVYDCGLFVLYFMERFIQEAPQRLQREDLTMFGRKWFQPEDASGLRKRLKDLLLEEFESSRLEHGREQSQESLSSSSETTDEEPNIQP